MFIDEVPGLLTPYGATEGGVLSSGKIDRADGSHIARYRTISFFERWTLDFGL